MGNVSEITLGKGHKKTLRTRVYNAQVSHQCSRQRGNRMLILKLKTGKGSVKECIDGQTEHERTKDGIGL
jgi:hypothetical protein